MNVGDDVLLFYNDKQSFDVLIQLMRSERHRLDEGGPLQYHINLVQLLACCTEGKNVYTEIKCHSLLPLDDIVRVVTHPDCIPEVRLVVFNGLGRETYSRLLLSSLGFGKLGGLKCIFKGLVSKMIAVIHVFIIIYTQ